LSQELNQRKIRKGYAMSTLTTMTGPGTGQTIDIQHQDLLTQQQRQNVKDLPPGHEFVGVLGRTPIVRRPNGHLSRMRTSGRLVKTTGMKAAESYLLVHG
jgi:hypothetical protein